jgi:hypothetical protein
VQVVRYASSRKIFRIGTAMRDHHRDAGEDRAGDEVGAKIVVCQPGTMETAKSHDTTECTESTSGVASAARKR